MNEREGQQVLELRRQAVLALSTTPTATPTRLLQDLISARCPLEVKYREVNVTRVLQENVPGKSGDGLLTISRAFNILEKYGRNLLSLQKPKFWRAVKFNNPVFKSTVDGIKGGRAILHLYGYTVEQSDGMSFPDEVQEPHHGKVAAVTLEVALLQMELDELRKGAHPHPELFSRFLLGSAGPPCQGGYQEEETVERPPPASSTDPQEPLQSMAMAGKWSDAKD
ncbi:E3 ubiquitin-protein ligase RNF31-like isoform X2 [Scyliorhinus torazame]|uniref:E3 ubiquitin-protein ligase RNF31-like isoform X1 n=1 Tax=Scyliorhinus torazame TaxID=75743 RepID=UPI003B5C343D